MAPLFMNGSLVRMQDASGAIEELTIVMDGFVGDEVDLTVGVDESIASTGRGSQLKA